jgi:magnesium transporter
VSVDGVHDPQIIKEVGEEFELHPLILEDILNTKQRPKVEEYGDTIFVVARMIWHDKNDELQSEHISFVLAENFVLCFQEQPGDVFEPLRERLRKSSGRIRSRGSDYLLYALLDTIVDNYFLVMEHTGIVIEELEEHILQNYSETTINEVHELKREMIDLQRYVWPLREVTNHMLRAEHNTFKEETLLFLRDLNDHTVQIIETIQMSREMINGMIDLSMNQASNRMNEVMKVLTIIATIFIPLTFIAGIYGMNFDYMPELGYRYGYFITWTVMIISTAGMLIFFKRKNWL